MMKKLSIVLFLILFVNAAHAQYKVGDPYEKDGIKAVVIHVNEDGSHGLIMTLVDKSTAKDKQWKKEIKQGCYISYHEKDNSHINAVFQNITADGKHNLEVLEEYCKQNRLDLKEVFPLSGWAKELGEGWFIPGNKELEYYSKYIGIGLGKDIYADYKEKYGQRFDFYKESMQKREELIKKEPSYQNLYLPIVICSSTWEKGGSGLKKDHIHPYVFSWVYWKSVKSYYGFALINNYSLNATMCYPIAVCEF